MELRSKLAKLISRLSGRDQDCCDCECNRTTSTSLNNPVEAEQPSAEALNSGNEALDDHGILKTTSSAVRGGTHSIVKSGCEAHEVCAKELSGFLNDAHHFTMSNSTMVDNSTKVVYKVTSDREIKAKKLLSKHTIPSAAHDSSARDPPPKCHPGTRIEINEGILAWFHDENKRELVLWIYGPAGVGKSAIVQTIAEALAIAKCMGASVFFSRANGRNDSHAVFITIAYQLAVHIESYCKFIGEKLASDPELVNKGMKEQFRALIVEPFVEKKIGTHGKTWGILLDGLDELDERHWQREIILLITAFSSEHPHVPLAWIIASRPEPHISTTFRRQPTSATYREEHVPIDSPEACRDIERFLRDSFDNMYQHLPHIVPQDWPEEMKFAKLAHASSGLFAFADVAVRYIEDPKYTDPVARLDDVLSVIDHHRVSSPDDQPLARLDAMYTRILSSIPSKTWLMTRRVLSTIPRLPYGLTSAKGFSVILSLDVGTIYASINDLFSVLDISLHDVYSEIEFRHASFYDFLTDENRSKEYYIRHENTQSDLDEGCHRIWLDFKRRSPSGPKYLDRWSEYVSRFHSDVRSSVDVPSNFDGLLFFYIHDGLFTLLRQTFKALQNDKSAHNWDQLLDLLCHMDTGFAWNTPYQQGFVMFWFEIWTTYQKELTNKGIAREIQLEQLRLDHLEWPKEYPTHAGWRSTGLPSYEGYISQRKLSSPEQFNEYISGLKCIQQRNPKLQVLICGTPGSRYAVFRYQYSEKDFEECPLHMEEADPKFDESDFDISMTQDSW